MAPLILTVTGFGVGLLCGRKLKDGTLATEGKPPKSNSTLSRTYVAHSPTGREGDTKEREQFAVHKSLRLITIDPDQHDRLLYESQPPVRALF